MSSNPSNISTTSLQSNTTVTSTTPLGQSKTPQKDYSAAFATLQSRYGTGGHIPTPKPDQSKLSNPPTSSSSNMTLTTSTSGLSSENSGSSNAQDPKKKGLFQKLKRKIKSG